jgi:hypothetical protein
MGGFTSFLADAFGNAGKSVIGGIGDGIGGAFRDRIYNKLGGGGPTNWEREQYDKEQEWATRNFDRDQQWRNEDIARNEKNRAEDIERNSLPYQMQEMKAAGLHGSLALGGLGGDSGFGGGRIAQNTAAGGRVIPSSNQGQGNAAFNESTMAIQSQLQNDKAQRALLLAETNKAIQEGRETSARADEIEYNNTEGEREQRSRLTEATINQMNSQITRWGKQNNLDDKSIEELEKIIERYAHDNKIYKSEENMTSQQRDAIYSDMKNYALSQAANLGKDVIDAIKNRGDKGFLQAGYDALFNIFKK